MHEWWEVIWIFVAAYALAALCGAFRQVVVCRRRKLFDVLMGAGYAGCVGLILALMCSEYFQKPRLLGICGLSGLTGIAGVDEILGLIRKTREGKNGSNVS